MNVQEELDKLAELQDTLHMGDWRNEPTLIGQQFRVMQALAEEQQREAANKDVLAAEGYREMAEEPPAIAVPKPRIGDTYKIIECKRGKLPHVDEAQEEDDWLDECEEGWHCWDNAEVPWTLYYKGDWANDYANRLIAAAKGLNKLMDAVKELRPNFADDVSVDFIMGMLAVADNIRQERDELRDQLAKALDDANADIRIVLANLDPDAVYECDGSTTGALLKLVLEKIEKLRDEESEAEPHSKRKGPRSKPNPLRQRAWAHGKVTGTSWDELYGECSYSVTLEGIEATGYAYCDPQDVFSTTIGQSLARDRALKGLEEALAAPATETRGSCQSNEMVRIMWEWRRLDAQEYSESHAGEA